MATLFIIPSTGQACEVDDDVYKWAIKYNWYLKGNYVYRWEHVGKRQYREVALHREIMGDPAGMHVHHKNENTLDCRRSNLQVLTQGSHMTHHLLQRREQTIALRYSERPKRGAPYKGVCWHKRRGKWVVQFSIDGTNHTLGAFDDPDEAAVVYDACVITYRGKGYTNLVPI